MIRSGMPSAASASSSQPREPPVHAPALSLFPLPCSLFRVSSSLGGPMPIVSNSTANPVEMLPGVVRRTLTDGDKMMLCEIRMEAGAVVPLHTHPHEQTGYLVSGRCRFKLGDEVRELSPGDTWMVPGGVEHEATALPPSAFVH